MKRIAQAEVSDPLLPHASPSISTRQARNSVLVCIAVSITIGIVNNDSMIDDHETLYICADCIGESYLSAKVRRLGDEHECHYCDETAEAISLDELADEIDSAFEVHYTRTASDPDAYQSMMLRDKESNYEWEREGQETVYAIMEAAEISEDAANDVQEILEERHADFDSAAMGEECEFASDAHYEEIMPDDQEWQRGWHKFEKTIKSEARFFSRTAAKQLDDLFATIADMQTRNGRPIIVDAGPDADLNHLFRARVFQSRQQLEVALARPDRNLAPPPSHLATAGRMNAHGISVFYGATEAGIALAEVRPPVGAQVMVARFDIVRPIRLLDLTALPDLKEDGSIFDPEYAFRLGRMRFLKTLAGRMSRPVMPDDQLSDYLPTQAVADFLATESKVPLDGIIFPSVQANGSGLNVVLFHKSSRVEELDIPKGTEISAHSFSSDDDGPYPDYTVYEEVPPPEPEKEDEAEHDPFMIPGPDWEDIMDGDYRDGTLRIDPQAIWVHIVEGIKIETDEHKVSRHRWAKTDTPF